MSREGENRFRVIRVVHNSPHFTCQRIPQAYLRDNSSRRKHNRNTNPKRCVQQRQESGDCGYIVPEDLLIALLWSS